MTRRRPEARGRFPNCAGGRSRAASRFPRRRAAFLAALAAALAGVVLPVPEAFAFLPDRPFSDKAVGTTSAAFLRMPAGARAMGLAETQAASASGSEAVFWNPAGLAGLEDSGLTDLSINYNALLDGAHGTSLAAARPFPRLGVVALSFVYFSAGELQGYDPLGDRTETFSPHDVSFGAAYGKRLGALSVGGGVKLVSEEVADVSGVTGAFDLGVQAEKVTTFGEGAVDAGASIRHLGPPLTMSGSSAPLPFKLQSGFRWHLSKPVKAHLDGHFPADDDPYATVAVEAGKDFSEGLRGALRAGFNMRHTRGIDGLSGLTLGLGVDLRRFRIDYAWVPLGELGQTNRFSFGVSF